jgi:hypothetical protein
MTQANDSILVTPGSGATVATHAAAGKEHQLMMMADEAGHILGTKPTWYVALSATANVAAARTTHLDIFNASGSGVVMKIWGVYIMPALAAVTGVGMTWEIIRTNAVGTGGSTLTPGKFDTANAALPAQLTVRGKPTGGATTDATNPLTVFITSSSEETTPVASIASFLENIPGQQGITTQPLVVRQNEGFKVDQTTNSAVGTTTHALVFTVE